MRQSGTAPPEIARAGRGTYVLILRLAAAQPLRVGRLGTFDLRAGWYAYVGSALHRAGLGGRLRHHLSPVRRPHWHIDYLRRVAVCAQVWYLEKDAVREHAWAALLGTLPGASIPIRRFGASDCRCAAHLFHFPECPDFALFRASLARQWPGEGPILLWQPAAGR